MNAPFLAKKKNPSECILFFWKKKNPSEHTTSSQNFLLWLINHVSSQILLLPLYPPLTIMPPTLGRPQSQARMLRHREFRIYGIKLVFGRKFCSSLVEREEDGVDDRDIIIQKLQCKLVILIKLVKCAR